MASFEEFIAGLQIAFGRLSGFLRSCLLHSVRVAIGD